MTSFVCVNVGNKYPKSYTETLYNMVQRNTTVPHKFYVITDQVTLYPEPHFITVEPPTDDVGWWVKMSMYKQGVLPPGDYLYCDLDVVIVDNIDCFFEHEPFGILRDFIRPENGLDGGKEFNSSVVRFDNRRTNGIWDYYAQNTKHWKNRQKQIHFYGDQNVVSSYLNYYPDFGNVFPDEWVSSFKKGSGRGERVGDKTQWFGRIPEEGVKIVCFHGNPSPMDLLKESLNPNSEWLREGFLEPEVLEWIEKNWK